MSQIKFKQPNGLVTRETVLPKKIKDSRSYAIILINDNKNDN